MPDICLFAHETIRQSIAKPLWDELHVWLQLERQRVPDGTTTAKTIDYTLRRWEALTRSLHDGNVAVENNHIENLMRSWAMGRNQKGMVVRRQRDGR
jgi:transposase